MRKKLLISLLVVSIMTLLPVISIQGHKPAPNLIGTMDLQYNLAWPGPQADIPDWVGTITIGSAEYGMAFFCIGSGKSFDDAFKGKIHFFEEIWVIYGELEFTFDETGVLTNFEPGSILLCGYDKGQTNIQTSKYHMSGYVEEANGVFLEWANCNVYMKGIIEWQFVETPDGPVAAPYKAPGTMRIN